MGTKLSVLAGVSLVMLNRALTRLSPRRRKDGWRRGAGLVLRDLPATFVLSAFALDVWSDEPANRTKALSTTQAHLRERLAKSLVGSRECHVRVRRTESEDVAELGDGANYSLAFEPWIDSYERFVRPEEWGERDHDDSSRDLLNIVARIAPNGCADLWFRINHVGTDGVPTQEMISRLESEWGTATPVLFPTPEQFAPHVRPRSCRSASRTDLCEMQAFTDFTPLRAWRKKVNATLPESITVSAALMWCLSAHSELSQVRIGTTVDVPAMGHLPRCVGVVVMRPSGYRSGPNGLSGYVREFNRQIELTRTRRSSGAKTLDACAHLPPKLASTLLRYALEVDTRAFGTMGLTILKDAKVFGAPLGDTGHQDGFIAVGSINLPTSDSRKVGCVHIKGSAARIGDYAQVIQQAIDQM
ncbi:MAG: hypothetical protein H7Z14_12060 [Anaerolineae bacterium]|nr:hypothetical protein [Phycisphaerae bacterium]